MLLLFNKKKGRCAMANLILFINSFLSYLLVMAVIVVLAGVAVFVGIKMRKRSNEKSAVEAEAQR